MPERTPITDWSSFEDAVKQAARDTVATLDTATKASLAEAVRVANILWAEHRQATDPAVKQRKLNALNASRSTIENILWTEARHRANAFEQAVFAAGVDLLINVGIAAI